MSYVALYRKFRPEVFEDVKGQEHIVTALRNQVRHNRVGHAYLFCGTRGTGKTTLAKLMAKAVNCENLQDGSPCNECESCKAIAAGSAMNVIEIDAASNSGVDNARQIKENVQYAPANGKKLVYIIDEAHMLTRDAQNALLKTIEEPPEYCIFIFATTEDYKIPVTIKSRCQKYDFHRITIDTIAARLDELTKKEGVETEPEALRFIARAGDGSMRDALSILDECISTNLGEKLTYDSVLKTIGAVDVEVYMKLIESIRTGDASEMLGLINDSVWAGKDLVKYSEDFLWFVRNLLFLKLAPDSTAGIDMTHENIERLKKLGENYSVEALSRYLKILQRLSIDVRTSSIKRITIETAFIKLMRPDTDKDYDAIVSRLERLENGTAGLPDIEGMPHDASDQLQAAPQLQASPQVEALVSELVENRLEKFKESLRGRNVNTAELSEEESGELVKSNIAMKYPEARAEEVIEFARNWKEFVSQLHPLMKFNLQKTRVEPDNTFTDSNEVAGIRILVPKNEASWVFFISKENENCEFNRNELTKLITDRMKRKIKVDFLEVEGSISGYFGEDDIDLNSIQFDDLVIH